MIEQWHKVSRCSEDGVSSGAKREKVTNKMEKAHISFNWTFKIKIQKWIYLRHINISIPRLPYNKHHTCSLVLVSFYYQNLESRWGSGEQKTLGQLTWSSCLILWTDSRRPWCTAPVTRYFPYRNLLPRKSRFEH